MEGTCVPQETIFGIQNKGRGKISVAKLIATTYKVADQDMHKCSAAIRYYLKS